MVTHLRWIKCWLLKKSKDLTTQNQAVKGVIKGMCELLANSTKSLSDNLKVLNTISKILAHPEKLAIFKSDNDSDLYDTLMLNPFAMRVFGKTNFDKLKKTFYVRINNTTVKICIPPEYLMLFHSEYMLQRFGSSSWDHQAPANTVEDYSR